MFKLSRLCFSGGKHSRQMFSSNPDGSVDTVVLMSCNNKVVIELEASSGCNYPGLNVVENL